MDFEPATEQKLLREAVRSFVRKHCTRQNVRQWERERVFPENLHHAMVNSGYLSMAIPEPYGGLGSSMMDCTIVYEELARPAVDFAYRVALTAWGSMILSDFACDELRHEILPQVVNGSAKLSFSLTEPASGSDAAALRTRARRQGDDWVISGQKVFSTGAHAKDNLIIVAARTGSVTAKHKGISLFLVPNSAPKLSVRRMETISRNMIGTNELFFDEVRVPGRSLIGEEGEGWSYITRHLERERITVAAVCLGNAGSAVDDAVAYAKERQQFGQPIGKFQAIAHMLADMTTELEAGRWLTAMAAWRYDQGLPCAREASMAKLYCSEMHVRVTTQGMQTLGGHGFTVDHDMQRYWRDARNSTVGGGTSQIMRGIIARELGL